MQENFNPPKKQEHLKEGVKPIFVSVGTPGNFSKAEADDEQGLFQNHISKDFGLHNPQEINWEAGAPKLREQNFLNSGELTYVISTLDSTDKFSKGLFPCTSLIVCGISKKTGEKISFLTHLAPRALFSNLVEEDKKDEFIDHLRQRLTEVANQCEEGTVDAVIVGGAYASRDDDRTKMVSLVGSNYIKSVNDSYIGSIKLVSTEVARILKFEPTVVYGPKINSRGQDDIYFDNENRRAYLVRPELSVNTKDFVPSDIEEERRKWQ